MTVIEEIAAERTRQVVEEGHTRDRDVSLSDNWVNPDHRLRLAAACYVLPDWYRAKMARFQHGQDDQFTKPMTTLYWLWPFTKEFWKPKDARRDLIRAAALIVAEIERMDRVTEKS